MPHYDPNQIHPKATVFFEHIFWNAEVCSHCFTRIRKIDPINDIGWGSRLATHPSEHRHLTRHAAPGHDDDIHDDYGELTAWHSRTYCDECGTDTLAADDTLPLSRMMAFARNLVEYLAAQNIDCDLSTVRDTIRDEREDPDSRFRNKDTELFAYATGRGVVTAELQQTRTECPA